jgi:hypothetical protein
MNHVQLLWIISAVPVLPTKPVLFAEPVLFAMPVLWTRVCLPSVWLHVSLLRSLIGLRDHAPKPTDVLQHVPTVAARGTPRRQLSDDMPVMENV